MLTKQGFTSFNVSSDGLMERMDTWMDLERANAQNVECGLQAQPYQAALPSVFSIFKIVYQFLTQGVVDNALLSSFASEAVFRDGVGRPQNYLNGSAAISKHLIAMNATASWTSNLVYPAKPYDFDQTRIMFSGNNFGFLHTLAYQERGSSCISAWEEFVSVSVDSRSGLIQKFDVYYDADAFSAAIARCS